MARPPLSADPALLKRIVAGCVLAAAAVADVLLGGWAFVLLLLLAILLMAREWQRLAGPDAWAVLAFTALVPAAALLVCMGVSAQAGLLCLGVGTVLAAGTAALGGACLVERAAGGVIYVGLPALSLLWLRTVGEGGPALVLWLFLVVWATDSCAYFAGRGIGGPRLAPRVSPSKTWAGLGGGMAGAALTSGVFVLIQGGHAGFAALGGAVLAVVAQAGDLFESWLKRQAAIKDSGGLIPGHGGLLDRVDGLVFAAPAFALLILLVRPESVQ